MAFPNLLLLLTVVAVLGPGIPQLIAALGLSSALGSSRVLRSATLALKENQHIKAAARSAPDTRG